MTDLGLDLTVAASEGNVDKVRQLLAAGADKNAQDPFVGLSPLHLAASYGYKSVVEVLLAAGADKNLKTKSGDTPLDVAKKKGHTALIDVLTYGYQGATALTDQGIEIPNDASHEVTITDSDITFACVHCGHDLVVDRAGVGLSVLCPECQKVITVPAESADPAGPTAVIRFLCPHCGQHIMADETDAGAEVPCPSCAQPLAVPPGEPIVSDQDHDIRCGATADLFESLPPEEREQYARLAGLESLQDFHARENTMQEAFWRLYEVFTATLAAKLEHQLVDDETLQKCYYLCCHWSPVLSPEQKKSYGIVYARLHKACWARAEAESNASISATSILCVCRASLILAASGMMPMEMAADEIENYTSQVLANIGPRADALCIQADILLRGMDRLAKAEVDLRVKKAAQLFAAAMKSDDRSVDALLGLYRTTGDTQLLLRAKSIDEAAVFRATFGRLPSESDQPDAPPPVPASTSSKVKPDEPKGGAVRMPLDEKVQELLESYTAAFGTSVQEVDVKFADGKLLASVKVESGALVMPRDCSYKAIDTISIPLEQGVQTRSKGYAAKADLLNKQISMGPTMLTKLMQK